MRKKQIFNKTIMFALVLSIVLAPLSFAQKAKAQSASAYLKGVLPAVAQLPLCSAEIESGISSLFKNTSDKFFEDAYEKAVISSENRVTLDDVVSEEVSSIENIPVYDTVGNASLNEIKSSTKTIDKKVSKLEANDTCLKSIGRLLIKMLLQKMTLSTVDWINNGFNGSPAFLEKPGEFFEDIAKNEILQFGAEIDNPELFPFGRAFMENQAVAFKNKFADNARYSLNELITDTNPSFSAATFSEDFSQGGWDAWTYMTQIPANNPLGFQIMASNELQKRLAGTEQSDAQNLRDSLTQAGGFLGDMRCSSNDTITKEEHDAWLRGDKVVGRECKGGFKYVTPGGMVAQAATNLVNYPENNLLKADDLNDAIAAILDALLNKWSSDLMNSGFSTLEFANGAESGNLILENNFGNYGTSQTSLDYTDFVIEASSWLKQNPDFNIRTDLNQALIDEQRTYSEKLVEQNKELFSTVPKTTSNPMGNYGLIPTIYQLDYCIPGPHPGWENDSKDALTAAQSVIPSKTAQDFDNINADDVVGMAETVAPAAGAAAGMAIGAAIGTVVPVIGNVIGAVIGAVIGVVAAILLKQIKNWTTSDEEKVQNYYSHIFTSITGVDLADDSNKVPKSKGELVMSLNIVFKRYVDIIHEVYDNPNMPGVTSEAALEFNKLKGYGKIMSENTDKINSLKSVIVSLEEIKTKVDLLKSELTSGLLNEDEYEGEIKPLLAEFGRLSTRMFSGDDIASVDKRTKEIIAKKDYIYKNLLKGPYGCEYDLSVGDSTHLPWQILTTKRMTYYPPIFYDYNNYNVGETLPDPFGSGYQNKIITKTTVGPGFLSWLNFTDASTTNACKGSGDDFSNDGWKCRLNVDDLFSLGKRGTSVGERPGGDDWSHSGIWEDMIGVY